MISVRGILDCFERLVAATTQQIGGMHFSGLRMVMTSLYLILQCLVRLALNCGSVHNHLFVDKVRVKEIAKSFRIFDLSTFGSFVV